MNPTPKQIENWRNVLVSQLGPHALIMPAEDIERIATNMQHRVDLEEVNYSKQQTVGEARRAKELAAREIERNAQLASLAEKVARKLS